MDLPVPLITEKIVADVLSLPQERVKNRVTHTGKVFTVRHNRGDQAGAVDTVGLNIKELDKYNMPRPGDVMVPVPQNNQGTVEVTQRVPQAMWSKRFPGSIGNHR